MRCSGSILKTSRCAIKCGPHGKPTNINVVAVLDITALTNKKEELQLSPEELGRASRPFPPRAPSYDENQQSPQSPASPVKRMGAFASYLARHEAVVSLENQRLWVLKGAS